MLSQNQVEFFHASGYLVVENAVTKDQLRSLRKGFDRWVEESRSHETGWGNMVNGKLTGAVKDEATSEALKRCVRAVDYNIPMSELPKGASFFEQQKSGWICSSRDAASFSELSR